MRRNEMYVLPVVCMQQALGVAYTLLLAACSCPQRVNAADYEEFDFIVVGGGSAGSVVADRLSECGDRSVLVVDAGDDPPAESMMPGLFPYLPQTRSDWNFTSENDNRTAQEHKIGALNLTSGHVLGGGSSVNYMLYVRGCPKDYDSWAQIAQDDTWSYRNVLPYFIKSEKLRDPRILKSSDVSYHGTTGFLGVTRENHKKAYEYLDAFKEAGEGVAFDVNGRSSLGYTLPLYTIADGVRQTTAYTNLAAHRRRSNLRVLKNTFVTEILFDGNNTALGVRARTNDDRELILLARREVVVSAGALNTPKLLMLSGVGPRRHLLRMNITVRSELPVGRNLQDHVLNIMAFRMEKSSSPPEPFDPHRIFPCIVGYETLNTSSSCAEYQVIHFILPDDSKAAYQLCTFNAGYKESICRNILEAGKGRNVLFAHINLLHPKSRGLVQLRCTDPRAPPLVRLRTMSDARDLNTLADALHAHARLLHAPSFRRLGAALVDLRVAHCAHEPFGSRAYWRCYAPRMADTMYHYAGTCALGTVLDARLRVRGVRRLRVADASAMPTLPSGNTNAPTIMIAEKAADFIKQDHYCTS